MRKALKSKLALLNKQKRQTQKAKPTPSPLAKEAMVRVLGGEILRNDGGEVLVVRKEYPLKQRYGRHRLQEGLEFQAGCLAQIYPSVSGFDVRDSLFFDTETTGLAGGSGTYAFLVGLGFFEQDRFVCEQLMMGDFADEPALLEHFRLRLSEHKSLVSFNGRSFDAQLLATRFAMHRMKAGFEEHSHLDLLHLSRRLWGLAPWPDCRLETLEAKVLGAPRHNDVPGWMIPDLFFDFLRDKNPAPLKGVLEHNLRDLLAMVSLLARLQQVMTTEEPEHAYLSLGLARLWATLKESDRSDQLFRRALKSGELVDEQKERALVWWARDLKQRKKHSSAAQLWRKTLTHYPANLEATVELAKWLEHKERDYQSALMLVEGGLRDSSLTVVKRRGLEHRAQRLRSRVSCARQVPSEGRRSQAEGSDSL